MKQRYIYACLLWTSSLFSSHYSVYPELEDFINYSECSFIEEHMNFDDRDNEEDALYKKTGYAYSSHVPADVWCGLEQFFLPFDHPVRKKLDRLFHTKRISLSKSTFERAGFKKIKERGIYNIVVGHHPNLSGYIVKLYLDTQPGICMDWHNWLKRIEGAHTIREIIHRHHFEHLFVVPQKWIYPLPAEPAPPEDPLYAQKDFILVVEDMRILDKEANLKAYKKKMTPELLNALYIVLTEGGLIDSVYPDNTPFTKSGKIAFIDTEHHHLEPVNYGKLRRHLSPTMQNYWDALVNENNNR